MNIELDTKNPKTYVIFREQENTHDLQRDLES